MTLIEEYRLLIQAHRNAVATDEQLGMLAENSDSEVALGRKAETLWNKFYSMESDFLARLEAPA